MRRRVMRCFMVKRSRPSGSTRSKPAVSSTVRTVDSFGTRNAIHPPTRSPVLPFHAVIAGPLTRSLGDALGLRTSDDTAMRASAVLRRERSPTPASRPASSGGRDEANAALALASAPLAAPDGVPPDACDRDLPAPTPPRATTNVASAPMGRSCMLDVYRSRDGVSSARREAHRRTLYVAM